MPEPGNDIAVIILAAGASSRMGKPKQLLAYKGTTLLGHAIVLAQTVSTTIIVVTGALHNEISASVNQEKVDVVHNSDWETGMASSLSTGLKVLENHPEIKGAMILLCDQPLITAGHLEKLQQAFISSLCENIIATTYQEVCGVPAIFPKKSFNDLLQLSGDEGARKLLREEDAGIISIAFERASLDIDTPGDYHKITGKN